MKFQRMYIKRHMNLLSKTELLQYKLTACHRLFWQSKILTKKIPAEITQKEQLPMNLIQTIGDTNENSQDDVNSGETTKEDKEGNGIEDTDETKAQNATQDKDKSAETGDSFPITILVIVAVIAVLCIIGILLSRKFMKK